MLARWSSTVRSERQKSRAITRAPDEFAIFVNKLYFGAEYPKLQILTIEGLMSGTERPRYPDLSLGRSTFKRAQVEDVSGKQGKIF